MGRARVFVTQPIAESALERLRAVADVEVNPDSSKIIAKADLCAGVARNDILLSLLHDTVDRDVMDANPRLRAINSMVITPDRIDVAEATAARHSGHQHPGRSSPTPPPTSAFGLLLAVARRIVEGDRLFRTGVYPGSQSNHLAGAAVSGKTIGIVGAGRIGQAVARRAYGFGMRILYSDPRRLPEADEARLGMVHKSYDDLLREADFVSLHPQLGPDTRHLIGARELGLMKTTAFVINTSRGPVIDEAALMAALQAKQHRRRRARRLRARAASVGRTRRHGERRADAASRQRRVRIARGHGACRRRQRHRRDRGAAAAGLINPEVLKK